ncbi:MAG: hypothetical protein WC475_02835 [Candidatus Paceibacterota bacterium]
MNKTEKPKINKMNKTNKIDVPVTSIDYTLYFNEWNLEKILKFINKLDFKKDNDWGVHGAHFFIKEKSEGKIKLLLMERNKSAHIKPDLYCRFCAETLDSLKETVLEFENAFEITIKTFFDEKTLTKEDFIKDIEKWKNGLFKNEKQNIISEERIEKVSKKFESIIKEIRKKLIEYNEGKIPLLDFEEWLIVKSTDIYKEIQNTFLNDFFNELLVKTDELDLTQKMYERKEATEEDVRNISQHVRKIVERRIKQLDEKIKQGGSK